MLKDSLEAFKEPEAASFVTRFVGVGADTWPDLRHPITLFSLFLGEKLALMNLDPFGLVI